MPHDSSSPFVSMSILERIPLLGGRNSDNNNDDSSPPSASPLRRAMTTVQRAAAVPTNAAKKPGLDAVLESLKESEEEKNLSLLLACVGIIGHVLGGAVFLHFSEGWKFIDAIYFCVVTTLTVGYGDIAPKRPVSKLFIITYIIASIAIISSVLANMVGALLDQQEELILTALLSSDVESNDTATSADAPQVLQPNSTDNTPGIIGMARRYIRRILAGFRITDFYCLGLSTVWLVSVLVLGVLCFAVFEGLSFTDSLYATVVSASTVGYGDYEPTQDSTKILMTIWLIFATCGVVKVISDYTDASVKAKQRIVTSRLLTARLDLKTWHAMDKNKDGSVDKAEFVTTLLIRTGKVDRQEVEELFKRFNALDEDNNGKICFTEANNN